ncbi:DUF2474 domain-containing protein [Alcaligenaceae bacterium]|nr:DUF2474 domain-containing protein [Alcaligenaceae bacterium]
MRNTPLELRSSRSWRLAWLVGIWAASVGVLAVVAWLLRLLMNWVGMTAGHF